MINDLWSQFRLVRYRFGRWNIFFLTIFNAFDAVCGSWWTNAFLFFWKIKNKLKRNKTRRRRRKTVIIIDIVFWTVSAHFPRIQNNKQTPSGSIGASQISFIVRKPIKNKKTKKNNRNEIIPNFIYRRSIVFRHVFMCLLKTKLENVQVHFNEPKIGCRDVEMPFDTFTIQMKKKNSFCTCFHFLFSIALPRVTEMLSKDYFSLLMQ